MRQSRICQRRAADERVELAPEHHPPLRFLLLRGSDALDQLGEPVELLLDLSDWFARFAQSGDPGARLNDLIDAPEREAHYVEILDVERHERSTLQAREHTLRDLEVIEPECRRIRV